MKKAVVLLSGGLDSTTTLYYAKSRGYKCNCLLFDYGQRHKREIESAKRIAKKANCSAQVIKINLPWKGSALLDRSLKIRELKNSTNSMNSTNSTNSIPSTYVPGRNIIFLSFALSYAEALGAKAIFIGANAVDYSGYPDCRPDFIKAFQQVINVGTKTGTGIHIDAPLIKKTKKEIVQLAWRLKVPLELTWSCYKGLMRPCGVCDSCFLRAKGFKEARVKDPLLWKQG